MTDDRPVLRLALTIRHDGHGGVADDLTTADALTVWVAEHRAALGVEPFPADDAALTAVRDLRAAVRALFALAVRPGPASRADTRPPMPAQEAVARLNAAAAALPSAPRLEWPQGGAPAASEVPSAAVSPPVRLTAALARDAIAFLAGPDREKLRACQGPRCVRYFVKEHPRQEWCKPSCGNRARVARHHERHRGTV
ncbi:ABATE domain-containing protein [Streptomyces sp. NPDC051940]|uniref:CGNR zinc finger domain-containing protein n=1 Tax=Streptomyces sp. NPDC051940 TaxID=3155675 RepID=UPI003412B788